MKKIILSNVIVILVLSMLLFVGCEDKKNTEVEEILDLDNVDVQLVDNWDRWAINSDTTAVATKNQHHGIYNSSRELIGYPYLLEEFFLTIEKHSITMDGEAYSSDDELIESIHFIDNQLWTEDEEGIATYYYDYFYNYDSGALWFHEDTSPDTLWAIDPTVEEDSLGNNLYDVNEFKLFFRNSTGPRTRLDTPENSWLIPYKTTPEDTLLNDMTPYFKWFRDEPVSEFNFQLCKDTLFTDGTNMVYDEIVNPDSGPWPSKTIFNTPEDLDNFTDYYWRVKADNKDWSEVRYFRTNKVVILSSPGAGEYIALKPTFKWDDLEGSSEYTFQLTKDVEFSPDNILYEYTTSELEYTIPEILDTDDEYYWRVKSDVTSGVWSIARKFYTTKAVDVSSTIPSDKKLEVQLPVLFEWDPLPNASNYNIQVATDSLFSTDGIVLDETVNDAYYEETGILEQNMKYYWRLESDVATTWSDTLSFDTNNKVLLDSPEDEAVGIGLITKFVWNLYGGNNGASTQYVIQVDDDQNFSDPVVDSYIYFENESFDGELMCETASIIEYNDDDELIELVPQSLVDFAPNTTYYWRVQRDTLAWSDTWSFTTLSGSGNLDLQEPVNGNDTVALLPQFKWPAVSGTNYYRLLVSLDDNFADTLWCNKVVDDNKYTLKEDENETLSLAGTFYWKARSDRTGWSDTWQFTVIDGIPSNLTIMGNDEMNNPITPNKVDISWSAANEDAFENFIIERSLNGTWEEIGVIATDDGSSFVDFALDYNSSYNYRVKTEYIRGFSDYSDVKTVLTYDYDLTNNLTLITVNPGSFTMGDSLDADDDEAPVHGVTLTNEIEIANSEVTNMQYCEVLNWALGMGKVSHSDGPYSIDGIVYADDAFSEDDILLQDKTYINFNVGTRIYQIESGMENLPVNGVTFFGAVAYCNWLSEINGNDLLYSGTSSISRDPYGGNGYRLPTEAEWEFVATNRGTDTFDFSGSDNIDDVAWYFGNANNTVHDVKGKAANGLGIYDMSGNVWEWCNDIYGDYESGTQTDPIGPTGNVSSSTQVVIRGGSWEYNEHHLRNTNRSSKKADSNTEIGFRVVKVHP